MYEQYHDQETFKIIVDFEILLSDEPMVTGAAENVLQAAQSGPKSHKPPQNISLYRAHEPNLSLHTTLFRVTLNLISSVNLYTGISVLLTFCVTCGVSEKLKVAFRFISVRSKCVCNTCSFLLGIFSVLRGCLLSVWQEFEALWRTLVSLLLDGPGVHSGLWLLAPGQVKLKASK